MLQHVSGCSGLNEKFWSFDLIIDDISMDYIYNICILHRRIYIYIYYPQTETNATKSHLKHRSSGRNTLLTRDCSNVGTAHHLHNPESEAYYGNTDHFGHAYPAKKKLQH